MKITQLAKRAGGLSTAVLFTLSVLVSSLVFAIPVPKASAELAPLPEPVAPSETCLWMGEMHYEMNMTNTYLSSGYNRTYDYEEKQDMVSAPVAGESCGAQWSASNSLSMKEYEPAYCTPDPTDTNTRTTTQGGGGSGSGRYTANIISSGTYIGQNYLLTNMSVLTRSGSVVNEFSNDTCGAPGSNTYDFWFGGMSTATCVTSPNTAGFDKDGFFVNPSSQASVGSCTRTVSSSETSGSHYQYEKFSWRMRKVVCNQSVDSDGGGASDCQEYDDNTNPMDVTDDLALVDTTDPTITINSPVMGDVTLGSAVYADFSCADEAGGSGLATCVGTVADGVVLDTSTVGTKSFVVDATDLAGNTSQLTVNYTVVYQNTGFTGGNISSTEVNLAKAGGTVPVQFRLTDASGNPISDSSSFVNITSIGTNCDASEPSDTVEQYTGGSGLQYLGDGYWQYNWKTSKAYAGQCRVLSLNLADGSKTTAKFQFK